MTIINFAEQNTVINQYMSELRDKSYQKNRLLFRNNIVRIGELMAYELSKTLDYKSKTVTTPLGTIDIPLPKDDVLLATVLRAGLPFHEGFLRMFDHAENGSYLPSACTPTANIPRWASTQSIWPRHR